MKNKSAYIVLGIGTLFVLFSIFTMVGYSIPTIVVALISVIAVLISLSDVLALSRFKKQENSLLVLALLIFIFLMIAWILQINIELPFLHLIGDSFTVLGFGIIIGLFGLKEILEDNIRSVSRKKPYKLLKEAKLLIISSDYEEMMKLNDIIERLRKLDKKVLPYNKVHNGWGLLYDSLEEHMEKSNGPFIDEMNIKIYYGFLNSLDCIAEDIGNMADPIPYLSEYVDIKMWNENFSLTIQPRINNSHVKSSAEIRESLNEVLLRWDEVKTHVAKRYERERSEIPSINN